MKGRHHGPATLPRVQSPQGREPWISRCPSPHRNGTLRSEWAPPLFWRRKQRPQVGEPRCPRWEQGRRWPAIPPQAVGMSQASRLKCTPAPGQGCLPAALELGGCQTPAGTRWTEISEVGARDKKGHRTSHTLCSTFTVNFRTGTAKQHTEADAVLPRS